jgi:hypothetical protein
VKAGAHLPTETVARKIRAFDRLTHKNGSNNIKMGNTGINEVLILYQVIYWASSLQKTGQVFLCIQPRNTADGKYTI